MDEASITGHLKFCRYKRIRVKKHFCNKWLESKKNTAVFAFLMNLLKIYTHKKIYKKR